MPTTRRGFLGATLGAAAATLARPLVADGPVTPAPSVPPASPSPSPTPLAAADPKVQALARLARERYGRFLTAEELVVLDERVAGVERRSARLRAWKLANADEPATSFRAGRP